MSKKLEKNGMWESSRMMLPEHKEAIIRQTKQINDITRPELDEQAIEDNVRILTEAEKNGRKVNLTVFDRLGCIRVTGYVQMDSYGSRLKLLHDSQKTWVPFCDIINVEL